MRVGVTVLLMLLVGKCLGEEWFMPDSRLISDEEWKTNVKEKGGFKMVKYFTPHCPYCRYLKAAVDKLKHEKEWCFEIYDLNCQWYPQFCVQEVKSTSFPYTVIYDQDGNLNEEIHGFYPEPVLRTIFDRVEAKCVAARDGVHPGEHREAAQEVQQPVEAPAEQKPEEQRQIKKAEDPAVAHSQPEIRRREESAAPETHVNEAQVNEIQQQHEGTIVVDGNAQQTKREQQEVHSGAKPTHPNQQQNNVYHYIFHALTIFLGAYYFKYINQHNKTEQSHEHHKTHKTHKSHHNPQPFQRFSPSLKDNLTQNS